MTEPFQADSYQSGLGQPSPISTSPDGMHYQCALCGAVLPDGCSVSADYSNNSLAGVHADTDPDNPNDSSIVHRCGTLAGL